jgi:hypothetical protein
MGTVLSGLSLLMALAIAFALLALAPRDPTRIWFRSRSRSRASAPGGPTAISARRGRGRMSSYSTLGYAFNFTIGAAGLLITGLIGFHVGRYRSTSGSRWSDDYIWWQVWMGLALACVAVWFWRKGLREIRSAVLIPEVVDGERDPGLPPSRRLR